MDKYFIVIVLVFTTIGYEAAPDPDMLQKVKDCKAESGATNNDLIELFKENKDPSTPAQFCLVGCFSKIEGIMTADNKFIEERIRASMDEMKEKNPAEYEKASALLSECVKAVNNNSTITNSHCTSTKALNDCLDEKVPADKL